MLLMDWSNVIITAFVALGAAYIGGKLLGADENDD